MELMRVPAAILEHAELRKPLRDEVVVVHVSRPSAQQGTRILPFHSTSISTVSSGRTSKGSITPITVRSASFPSSVQESAAAK